ncbi:MAG: TonB-dependent receptor, partial [Acidobacteria bacterium]|nr:TonB-dependent receptor [Acidobacteriota bacterium]
MVVSACLLLVPAVVAAQSVIAGQVTDNTGGVLPGVTVEAASPALIEQSRLAVTDGTGQYSIVNLRPGTYTLTFTLPGFGTQVRDELVLIADFTMNIDIALSVGAVEETVTVSGESPVVDVQQVQRTEVLTREVQEALPTGRSLWSYALLVPGVKVHKPDVGGTSGAQQSVMFGRGLGGQHTTVEVDGLMVNTMIDDGQFQAYLNPMMTAETSFTTSGIGAETQLGGLRINMIPQEGGNLFSGSFFGGGTPNGGWQADNWNQRLGDMNVKEDAGVPHIQRIYDFNAAVGGPIFRDKLWFFSSVRRNIINSQVLNSTKRDGSPGIDDNSLTSAMTRLTWQMSSAKSHSTSSPHACPSWT